LCERRGYGIVEFVGTEPPDAERFLRCPKCQAVAATADSLGRSVVYIRCTACGETWTIPERRKTPRTTDRKPRFPADPHEHK
jgi:predicted Zn finger-like uncharacterized protein